MLSGHVTKVPPNSISCPSHLLHQMKVSCIGPWRHYHAHERKHTLDNSLAIAISLKHYCPYLVNVASRMGCLWTRRNTLNHSITTLRIETIHLSEQATNKICTNWTLFLSIIQKYHWNICERLQQLHNGLCSFDFVKHIKMGAAHAFEFVTR